MAIAEWQSLSCLTVPPTRLAEERAGNLEEQGIKAKDAAHLACAIEAGSDYFITTDRKLMSRARKSTVGIEIINPLDFIAVLEGKYEK